MDLEPRLISRTELHEHPKQTRLPHWTGPGTAGNRSLLKAFARGEVSSAKHEGSWEPRVHSSRCNSTQRSILTHVGSCVAEEGLFCFQVRLDPSSLDFCHSAGQSLRLALLTNWATPALGFGHSTTRPPAYPNRLKQVGQAMAEHFGRCIFAKDLSLRWGFIVSGSQEPVGVAVLSDCTSSVFAASAVRACALHNLLSIPRTPCKTDMILCASVHPGKPIHLRANGSQTLSPATMFRVNGFLGSLKSRPVFLFFFPPFFGNGPRYKASKARWCS